LTDKHATAARSRRLFAAFRREQQDPDAFYRTLAADSAAQLARRADLRGARLLDVGGGPGYFADAFTAAGAHYLGVDPQVGDRRGPGSVSSPGLVRGSGTALPVRTGAVDVAYSSNVLEHVATPETMLDEMTRATRPGGLVFVAFTPWLSPWGGHETSPWHYLGGGYARDRYSRVHGAAPKNSFGESLFACSAGRALRWARGCSGVRVREVFPRYHPSWAHWVARVPGLREVASWNVVLVLDRV
jgi:SAM-dependent methyltransferase